VRVEVDQIEVTTAASSTRTYINGLRTVRIDLVAVYDSTQGLPPVGEPVAFDEIINGRRVRGEVLIERLVLSSPIDALATAEMSCIGTGPFVVEEATESPEPADLRPGRRAIALDGSMG